MRSLCVNFASTLRLIFLQSDDAHHRSAAPRRTTCLHSRSTPGAPAETTPLQSPDPPKTGPGPSRDLPLTVRSPSLAGTLFPYRRYRTARPNRGANTYASPRHPGDAGCGSLNNRLLLIGHQRAPNTDKTERDRSWNYSKRSSLPSTRSSRRRSNAARCLALLT